jgi:hypothetical protein
VGLFPAGWRWKPQPASDSKVAKPTRPASKRPGRIHPCPGHAPYIRCSRLDTEPALIDRELGVLFVRIKTGDMKCSDFFESGHCWSSPRLSCAPRYLHQLPTAPEPHNVVIYTALVLGSLKSHRDLAIALERLRDSYKELLVGKPVSDAHRAVLMGVEVTLREAEIVRELN